MRVGIIGAGLIGKKRAEALTASGDTLVVIADRNATAAGALREIYPEASVEEARTLCERKDIDAVIISTSNDAIPQFAIRALEAKKHVLLEKPAGRTPSELREVDRASQIHGRLAAVGFNHRFHPALQRAKQQLNEIGKLLYFRARYGHGGRIGYEKEWRADPQVSGGGELIDQGCHLIDLTLWLGGNFIFDTGRVHTFFWDMPVEDNGFLLLKSPDGKRYAWLHASCTEWKNLFEFEAFGDLGKIQVKGLGRSYGPEELHLFKINREKGAPDHKVESFPESDTSWALEWSAFKKEVAGTNSDIAKIGDALKTLEIIHAAYRESGRPYAQME
jgi:predicted dehydrogenase